MSFLPLNFPKGNGEWSSSFFIITFINLLMNASGLINPTRTKNPRVEGKVLTKKKAGDTPY
jgi:hypothetical protein